MFNEKNIFIYFFRGISTLVGGTKIALSFNAFTFDHSPGLDLLVMQIHTCLRKLRTMPRLIKVWVISIKRILRNNCVRLHLLRLSIIFLRNAYCIRIHTCRFTKWERMWVSCLFRQSYGMRLDVIKFLISCNPIHRSVLYHRRGWNQTSWFCMSNRGKEELYISRRWPCRPSCSCWKK